MPDDRLLSEAFERAAARVEGVVAATEAALEGDGAYSTDAALTVAGTDLDGVELARRIGCYTEAAGLDAMAARVTNGAALVWFLTGYEARRLQERGE